jgi:integrase
MPSNQVTTEFVERVRTRLRSPLREKQLKPATVNRHFIVLRRLFNWAVETRRIQYNPLVGLRMEAENNVKQTAIRSEEDFARLLGACDKWNRALCLVYFDGGLRRMEGFNLMRDQIQRKADGGASVRLPGAKTKNGHPRIPRLTRRAMEALDALPYRGNHFFARPDGKRPYSVRYLYERFRQAVERSGLRAAEGESITWHTLRHSFSYVRRAVDHWPESRIMAAGGWLTHASFDRYGIVDESEMDAAVEGVEERLMRPMLQVVRTGIFPAHEEAEGDAEKKVG